MTPSRPGRTLSSCATSACSRPRDASPPGAAAVASAGPLRILVLRGGPSAEREVSLHSGAAVAAALRQGGFTVLEADIAPDNLAALDAGGFDLVFPVLHGAFGEDGQLQAILEDRHIPYAGCDAASSRLAMNKCLAKRAFLKAGLSTPDAELIETTSRPDLDAAELNPRVERVLRRVGLPCVIKPNFQGSSIGVQITPSADQARRAVAAVLADYGDCLIERFIKGRELTAGILDDRSLPLLEVRPAADFYDYQAKYHDDRTQYLFDIDVPPALLDRAAQDARRAFAALRCRDFARVDLILDPAGVPYILEVNTIPGFTDHSLLPKAAARAGLSLAQMCSEIVRMAQRRSIPHL